MANFQLRTHKGDLYIPLPTQLAFHQSQSQCRSYIGFLAAGKSLCGSVEALLQAVAEPGYRPGKTLICREVFGDLVDSAWATFEGVVKQTCPALIKTLTSSTHELKMVLKNGWTFTGTHLGRWERFGSMEPDGIWIDECNDTGIDMRVYAMLRGRLGRGRFGKRLWCTGNPAGKNWCYDIFFKHALEGSKPVKGHEGFRPLPTENVHLPAAYWDDLRAFYPQDWIDRFLNGDFSVFEGAILSELNPELHLVDPFNVPMEWPRYRGLDHGINHPTVCVWVGVDYDGNHLVYREHVKSDAVPQTNAERILALSQAEEDRIQWTAIDPATRQRQTAGGQMAMIVDQYRDAGLICRLANNDISASITRLKMLLQPDEKHVFPRWHWRAGELGAPHLFISRDCKVSWHQLQLWQWKAVRPGQVDRERVLAKDDDAVSAIRYLLMELPRAPQVKPSAPYDWLKRALGELEDTTTGSLENPKNLIGA